jgi:hypothetical protein
MMPRAQMLRLLYPRERRRDDSVPAIGLEDPDTDRGRTAGGVTRRRRQPSSDPDLFQRMALPVNALQAGCTC